MVKYSLLLLLLISLFGCMKEIPFKGDIKEPRLVLNGIVEIDSTFSVYLERSVFFLSSNYNNESHITSGAEITVKNLSSNETFVVNQPSYNNCYEFPFITTPNTSYEIEVSHPDYPSISAKTTTLSKVDMISVDTDYFPGNYEDRMQVTLKFKDPPDNNYYLVKGSYLYSWVSYDYSNDSQGIPMDTVFQQEVFYMTSNDPSVDNSQNMDIDGYVFPVDMLLFSDELFNNQEKNFRFNVAVWGDEHYEEIKNSLKLELISMNEETYKYIKSAQMNIYNDPLFSEPTKVYSNINNGFGIFGFLNYSIFEMGE